MSGKSVFSMLLTGASLAFLAAKGASSKSKAGYHRTETKRNKSRQAADEATRRYLMYIIMPVWSLTGFLDWLWHRQTKIETTSGAKESVLHLLMMAEAGAPILTGLFLEMNAGALALMGAGWLAHEMTVVWDVNYTVSRRTIFPREQHTHGYMQTIPFDIIATMVCLHPEQSLSLLGLGSEKPVFKLRLRKSPVPLKDFITIAACLGLISGLPHVEELWRCYRAERSGLAGKDTPECARDLYAS